MATIPYRELYNTIAKKYIRVYVFTINDNNELTPVLNDIFTSSFSGTYSYITIRFDIRAAYKEDFNFVENSINYTIPNGLQDLYQYGEFKDHTNYIVTQYNNAFSGTYNNAPMLLLPKGTYDCIKLIGTVTNNNIIFNNANIVSIQDTTVMPALLIIPNIETAPTPEPKIINNIENTTYNYNIENENLTVNLETTDTQKRFTTLPSLTYTNVNNEVITENLAVTITENVSRATININLSSINLENDIFLNGAFANINIINNIENVNYTYTLNNYNVTFNLTQQNAQYRFTTQPTLNELLFNVEVDGNENETANLTIENADFTQKFVINGTSERVIKVVNNLQFCTVENLQNYYTANSIISLNLTANDLYFFEVAPRLEIYPIFQAFNFTINSDSITAIINIDLSKLTDTINYIYLEGSAVPITDYIKNYGAVNVYNVTNENLNDFAKVRFRKSTMDETAINLGDYILSAKKYFFDIGFKIPNILKIANYNTEINVNTPFFSVFKLDCGKITIPYENNNVTDYDCELSLFLPFFGFVNLDNAILNKELQLIYNIDIVANDCYIHLFADNLKINSYNCEPSSDILLKDKVNIYSNRYTAQNLDGLQPYIIEKFYNSESMQKINNDNIKINLNELNGFNVVTEIENFETTNLTLDEQNLIIENLQNGIYF